MVRKEELHEGQEVIVLVYYGRDWTRYPGRVIKIARAYCTIEYTRSTGRADTDQFSIEDQAIKGAQYSYSTRFRTVEQQKLLDRQNAAREGLRELGLQFRVGTLAGETLTLEEQEAIIRVVGLMRDAKEAQEAIFARQSDGPPPWIPSGA